MPLMFTASPLDAVRSDVPHKFVRNADCNLPGCCV